MALVQVTDDAPRGFADLSHAYTLFAPSYKKAHVGKAGRFNMGDKLFLAAAIMSGQPAAVTSTTGTIEFSEANGRVRRHVPEGVTVTLNTEALRPLTPIHRFRAVLPTVKADEAGVLRPVRGGLETDVSVYEPLEGETPSLYELGVPVVETGDKWHVNISQKVPLNFNRDNVPPAYLRTVRTLVVNEMKDRLTAEDANSTLVREATSDPRIEPEAMAKALDLRFGERRVAFDPSDPEANKRAVAEGYTVVHGRMLNRTEWANARKTGTTPAAGAVFPTPKPYSADGAPADFIPEGEWTEGMRRVAAYARFLHTHILGTPLRVNVLRGTQQMADRCCAAYRPGNLDVCLRLLGHEWFDAFGPDNHLYWVNNSPQACMPISSGAVPSCHQVVGVAELLDPDVDHFTEPELAGAHHVRVVFRVVAIGVAFDVKGPQMIPAPAHDDLDDLVEFRQRAVLDLDPPPDRGLEVG